MSDLINCPAPAFSLMNQTGESRTQADYLGRWVVVYFYPAALTPGCTIQAQALRDHQQELAELDAIALGVSPDEPAKLQKFMTKEQLNFELLSDTALELTKAFGCWGPKQFMGRKFDGVIRQSFIIDPQGRVRQHLTGFKTKEHHETVLAALRTLQRRGLASVPAVTLLDSAENPVNVHSHTKEWTLLYFFSKAGTAGCNKQALEIKQDWDKFVQLGVDVIGVSRDTPAALAKWKAKNELPFTLLSDGDAILAAELGALGTKKVKGIEVETVLRNSYVMVEQLVLSRQVKVKPAEHAENMLALIEQLQASAGL